MQIKIAAAVFHALAQFGDDLLFKRQGDTLTLAATDGYMLGMITLTADSTLLPEMAWFDDEPQMLSVPIPGKALDDMGKVILLTVDTDRCIFCGLGDGDSLHTRRNTAQQLNLFDALEALKASGPSDLRPAGQIPLNAKVLKRFHDAGKKLEVPQPEALEIALLDHAYGITFGGSAIFWGAVIVNSACHQAQSGLPPQWVTGNSIDEEPAEEDAPEPTFTITDEDGNTVVTTTSALSAALFGVLTKPAPADDESTAEDDGDSEPQGNLLDSLPAAE